MQTINLSGRSNAPTTRTPMYHFLNLSLIPFTLFAALISLLHVPLPALAQAIITVDNTDPSISYSGDWERLADDLDFSGSHQLTTDPTAFAVLNFSGTAIFFLAPLWPYTITTGISLDGETAETISLQDPASVGAPANTNAGETVLSAVLWSRTGLLDAQHTLTISVVPDPGGALSYAVVDALQYTPNTDIPPGTPSTPTTSPSILSTSLLQPSTTGTSAASSRNTHQNKTGLSIALGIVCTVFGLLLLYALRWFWRRRQRARQEAARSAFELPPPPMSESGPGAGMEAGAGTRRSAYTSIRTRSQRELAASAAAAAALEEEEEREKEREKRRRRPARGPSGLRHSTVVGSDSDGDGDVSVNGNGNGHGSVRRKRSVGPGDAMLGTIPERRESYAGGGAGAGDVSDPPWREVDESSRYPRGNQRTSRS